MLTDGGTLVTDSRPTLLVLNKKDLIKPGEVAKKKEVRRDLLILLNLKSQIVLEDHIYDLLNLFHF